MENETTVETAAVPLAEAIVKAKKPEAYHKRLRKMSNKALLAETKRVRREERLKSNHHGVALATVLEAVLSSHIKAVSPYPR